MATYKIKYGDTLSGIAQKYNTNVSTLMSLNPYITDANKIYAGNSLNLPGATNNKKAINTATNTTKTTSTSTVSQPTQTTQQLAQAYAQSQTANNQNDTNALLAQYEKIAEQQKQALAQQQTLATNQINRQKDDVLQSYNDNARQAYINKMLGQKSVEQQLSQAGLNTTGIVNSAYSNLENSYGNNLATLQASKDKSITDINNQVNDANLQYSIKQSELLADIENAKLELQKYGNQLAYQKYQDALNNYMTFANYDYQKAMNDRDYNYQTNRDKVADSQWQKEYELALKQLELSKKNSTGSGSGSKTTKYITGDDNSGAKSKDNTGNLSSTISSVIPSTGNANKTNTGKEKTVTLDDIIKGLKTVQGANVSKPIYDSYSGKYFKNIGEVQKYYS